MQPKMIKQSYSNQQKFLFLNELDFVYSGANVIQDFDKDKQLSGAQYTVGVGIGVDWHHRQTYTFTIIPVVDKRR